MVEVAKGVDGERGGEEGGDGEELFDQNEIFGGGGVSEAFGVDYQKCSIAVHRGWYHTRKKKKKKNEREKAIKKID